MMKLLIVNGKKKYATNLTLLILMSKNISTQKDDKMSRSTRQPIVKDRPRNYKKSSSYWRKVRRRQKQEVDLIKTSEEIEISNPKEVVNDYDYCDYIFRDCDEKYKRK